MSKLEQVLIWLVDKKVYLLGVTSALNFTLMAFKVYGLEQGAQIQGLLSVVFMGAKAATTQMGITKLGRSKY